MARSGSLVPFTIVPGCSTDMAMEENSTHALYAELVGAAQEMKCDWPEYLPMERIKAGIMEILLGLIAFAAVVAFYCSY